MRPIRELLHTLREHSDAIEADLSRFYSIDYRDRWRFDELGRRRLTLRMIHVRIKHLPPNAALWRVLGEGAPIWELEHVLLADIWQAVARSKKAHPRWNAALAAGRKADRKANPRRTAVLASARARAEDRRRRIAEGTIPR